MNRYLLCILMLFSFVISYAETVPVDSVAVKTNELYGIKNECSVNLKVFAMEDSRPLPASALVLDKKGSPVISFPYSIAAVDFFIANVSAYHDIEISAIGYEKSRVSLSKYAGKEIELSVWLKVKPQILY